VGGRPGAARGFCKEALSKQLDDALMRSRHTCALLRVFIDGVAPPSGSQKLAAEASEKTFATVGLWKIPKPADEVG
jgi:hypothetical protein